MERQIEALRAEADRLEEVAAEIGRKYQEACKRGKRGWPARCDIEAPLEAAQAAFRKAEDAWADAIAAERAARIAARSASIHQYELFN